MERVSRSSSDSTITVLGLNEEKDFKRDESNRTDDDDKNS